ncbi:MAG: di-heme oxidoredictase family protein [Pseudomonadota bacterium]
MIAQPGSHELLGDFKRIDLSQEDLKRVKAVTSPTGDFSKAEVYEASQGGAGTNRSIMNRNAFSQSADNLTFEQEEQFKLGNALFRKLWVSSPSSTQASDGLGPLFNARACQSCHLKDGRGHPPEGDPDFTSMLFRLARPAVSDAEKEAIRTLAKLNIPDPVYGGQIQDAAIQGLAGEGNVFIQYEERIFEFPDGETASLRKPTYAMTDPGYGPLHPETTLSPRIAQQMIGLGLIEAIHPADIMARHDPDDRDQDGISGKVSVVRAPDGSLTIGRFGWKASQRSLESQNAAAFKGDIGISSPLNPEHYGDCTEAQPACLSLPNGAQVRLGGTEAPDPVLELVTFYTANLAVPARRDVTDPQVLRGKEMFYGSGCVACHTPKFVTSRDAPQKEHRFQLIWPYSDFLLHDMGEGLADNQPVGSASGREWRTAPLWGIGLTEAVNGHTFFLHDGRARNLTEAILWHGGEAESARDAFAALPREDRQALIRFLESL